MKCLYCGKELAIFKRLSGSEFCSDDHRKQYQQEYNQIALTRLLHARPQSNETVAKGETALVPSTPVKKAELPQPAGRTSTAALTPPPPAAAPPNQGQPRKASPLPPPAPKPLVARTQVSNPAPVPVTQGSLATPKTTPTTATRVTPAPVAPARTEMPSQSVSSAPAPPRVKEPAAPAPIAGLLENRPKLQRAKTPAFSGGVTEWLGSSLQPERPSAPIERSRPSLTNGEHIPMDSGFVALRPAAISVHGSPEPREFMRPLPRLESLFKLAVSPLEPDVRPLPVPSETLPSGPVKLWYSEFIYPRSGQVTLGQIVLCDLPAAGLDDPAETDLAMSPAGPPAEQLTEDPAPGTVTAPDAEERGDRERTAPPIAETAAHVTANEVAAGQSQQESTPKEDNPAEHKPPVPPTKRMAIVPQVAHAGKAIPVPMPLATLPSSARAEIPRYDALPLRPVIVVSAATQPSASGASAEKKAPAQPAARPTQLAAAPETIVPSTKTEQGAPSAARSAQGAAAVAEKSTQSTRVQPSGPQPPNKTNGSNGSGLHAKAAPQKGKPVDVASPHKTPAAAQNKSTAANGDRTPNGARADGTKADGAAMDGAKNVAPEPASPKVTAPLHQQASPLSGNQDLNLPQLKVGARQLPNRTILLTGGGIVAVLMIVLAIFSMKGPGSSRTAAPPNSTNSANQRRAGTGPDWIENFSPDPMHPRTISVLRSTTEYRDYRIEMDAQIDSKALGWVFRAKDPGNFHVGKVEVQRAGNILNPYLVHYAVINGVAEPRNQVPLPVSVSATTVYHIRFEVSGNRFTAYVQNRKVDEWTDARLASGGAGLYSESGERAILQSGFDVTPSGKTK